MKTFFKIIGRIIISLVAVVVLILTVASLLPSKDPPYKTSLYIKMPDGTKLGIRQFLPKETKDGAKVPTAIELTRYGTGFSLNFPQKTLFNLMSFMGKGYINSNEYVDSLLDAGYAVILVDVRGSGISEGNRDIEWSDEEVADFYHVIDWIVNNEWSDGNVMAYGISYSGNTAELCATTNHDGLIGIAPLYSDFDPFRYLGFSGGIFNENAIQSWSDGNYEADTNFSEKGIDFSMQPVDGKGGKAIFEEILSRRHNNQIYELSKDIVFLDEKLVDEYTGSSLALYNKKDLIETANTPYYIRLGWQDAGTVNGALERFNTFNNPMDIYIGPWNHGGAQEFDELLANKTVDNNATTKENPTQKQIDALIEYFNQCLSGKTKDQSTIHYYTLGEGKWKETTSWPIKNQVNDTLYLNADNTITTAPTEFGSIVYEVDYTATTGLNNRWYTNLQGIALNYGDRREEDEKLLCFTSNPFDADRVITGNPVINLNVTASSDACAVYVYLEDVAPDGSVTYITEGALNALHRKVTTQGLAYATLPANHSYNEKDALPVIPGEMMTLEIPLYTTSVLIEEGHCIRISIAGHDASSFKRITNDEDQQLTLTFNEASKCFINIPFEQ